MPQYNNPPRSIYSLLVAYVDATYPGTSLACDPGEIITHVQNDTQSEAEFQTMLNDLRSKFPGAF